MVLETDCIWHCAITIRVFGITISYSRGCRRVFGVQKYDLIEGNDWEEQNQ